MYVAPDTNLRFIRNCKLAQNLDHTILFESREAQTAYFAGIAEYVRDSYSFQRRRPGVIRVDIPYESCIYFNYMCYQNNAHANKWFYAFVTGCEYINEGCTELYFTLDVLQTWMFDWQLGNCLVIRETTATDEPGEYLMDEPIALGDYHPTAESGWRATPTFLVGTTFDITNDSFPDLDNPVNYVGGQLREYQIYGTSLGGLNWANRLSQAIEAGKTSGIRWVFPYPKELTTANGIGSFYAVDQTSIRHSVAGRPDKLGDYTPRNKKLLTYPYCYICCVTTDGKIGKFRYEYFSDPNNPKFFIYGGFAPQAPIAAAPIDYNGYDTTQALTFSVILDGLPIGGFNYDVYSTWFALNKNTIRANEGWAIANSLLGVGGQAASSVAGLQQQYTRAYYSLSKTASASATASQVASSAVSSIAPAAGGAAVALGVYAAKAGLSVAEVYSNYHAQKTDMQAMPNEVGQHSGTGDLQLAQYGNYGFDFNTMCILPEFAKVADDFFDRCGYKVMTSKVPTLHNRTVWDFIQTGDTEIAGQIPLADLEEIKAVFERGITFWHSADTFGDYTQTNATTG